MFEKIKSSIKNNMQELKKFVNNNSKVLFLVVTLSGTMQMTAQQVAKRITDNTNETIVEMFVLRNGTSLPNVTGENNFNTGTSDATGNVIVYNPAIWNTYSKQQLPSGTASHGTEIVGNGNFPMNGNQTNTLNNTNFVANGGSWATLDLTIQQEDGTADNTSDSNSLSDLLYSRFRLPKALNDGSAIPNGLIVKCSSRLWKDNNTGATMPARQSLAFQRNQATLSWLPIATDRLWNIMPNLQEIGSDGQLGTDDFITNSSPKTVLFPNPAHESFTLDNGDNIIQTYDIEMFDALWRKVGQGEMVEWQAIKIDHLPNGTYVVKAHTEDTSITKQFIKN